MSEQIRNQTVPNTDKETNIERLKKFRYFRNLAASIVSFVIALILALTAIGSFELDLNNIFIKIMFVVLGTGVLYCAFAIAALALRLICGVQGFKPRNHKINLILDIAVYIALSVGGLFLFYFICQKVIWLGIALTLFGFIRAYFDLKFIWANY